MDLDILHPDQAITYASRVECRDLYEGTNTVRSKGEVYLHKGKNEDSTEYDLRLKRAVLDPFAEKIVSARQSLLFRKQPTRELPEALQAFEADVDMGETTAEVFFTEAAREAQIDGIAWVSVDMPREPEGGFVSRKEENDANHRPFFQLLPASAVIDWEEDETGDLNWAVVKQQRKVQRDAPGKAIEYVDQWKVWFRDYWLVYEREEGDTKDDRKYFIVSEGLNATGSVPLVPILGAKHTRYSGWSVIRTVAAHIVLIYNKASDLDWFERIASHPIPYVIGPHKPEKMDVAKGLYMQSTAGAQVEIGYLETQGTAFNSIRTSIDQLAARILSIALAQSKRDTSQVESAEGQREHRKVFSSSLATVAETLESAETQCWRLLAQWMSVDSAKLSVSYNKDFDDAIVDATMIAAFIQLVDGAHLTRETLLRLLEEHEILPKGFDVDEELEALGKQDGEAAANTLIALRSAEVAAA